MNSYVDFLMVMIAVAIQIVRVLELAVESTHLVRTAILSGTCLLMVMGPTWRRLSITRPEIIIELSVHQMKGSR